MSKTTNNVDWWAVTQAAQGLGINTRRLVALHDIDQAITWCLQMSRQYSGVTAISYFELATMLGHRETKVAAGAQLDWNELLRAVEKLAGTVKAKVAEEKAATDAKATAEKEAARKAAAQKAAAEKIIANADEKVGAKTGAVPDVR